MRVQEGDIIKFGRVRFKVKKIVVDQLEHGKEDDLGQFTNKKDLINVENELMQSGLMPNDTVIIGDTHQFDTRLFGRGDALAGFD